MSVLGAQTYRGEEGLAEGDGCGVWLQTVPLRTGRRKSHTTKCSSQPSHRYEVRDISKLYLYSHFIWVFWIFTCVLSPRLFTVFCKQTIEQVNTLEVKDYLAEAATNDFFHCILILPWLPMCQSYKKIMIDDGLFIEDINVILVLKTLGLQLSESQYTPQLKQHNVHYFLGNIAVRLHIIQSHWH